MNIAFISGGLEPGKNGVGDYSRMLAQELERRGHKCSLISLNDEHVAGIEYPKDMRCLRIPRDTPWDERIRLAGAFLTEQSADWVSLQFVPYSLHPKGIVGGEIQTRLQRLFSGCQLHTMFHELWIGDWSGAPLKERLIGRTQRYCVLRMLRTLQPAVVHTSNTTYRERLQRCGVMAQVLPLFGNIPVTQGNADIWLIPMLQANGVDITPASRDKFWLFGFFGSMRGNWPAEPLFSHLRAASKGRQIVILSMGRWGDEASWQALVERYSPEFKFLKVGEHPAKAVSEYLHSLDAGFAISPLSIIGKSGAAAAMIDHGVPVIVNRVDVSAECARSMRQHEPLLQPVDDTFLDRLVDGLPQSPAHWRLRNVADTFVQTLSDRAGKRI